MSRLSLAGMKIDGGFMIRLFLLAVFTASLIGCSVAPKTALPYSDDLLGTPDEESAIVVVYRHLVPPYAYDIRVHVNGERITQIPNEGFTWTRVEPGETFVELKWPFIAATPTSRANFEAEAGKTYFVQAEGGVSGFIPNAYGGTAILSSSAVAQSYEEAVGILRSCCRYIPADEQVQSEAR